MSNALTSRAADAALDDFRLTSSVEVNGLLRQMQSSNTLITLSGPEGHSYTTLLWSVDEPRGTISFSGDSRNTGLRALLASGEVQAVAYLDSIKVQFELDGLIQVHGGQHEIINARYPRELYRFQRRSAFRVKPFISTGPVASFPHPASPDDMVALRVLDVSLSGVALLLPDNVPAIASGTKVPNCQLRLDEETWLDVSLVIHHATPLPEIKGFRLGCEIHDLDPGDRSLQQYINQTQKRHLALAPRKD